MNKDIHNLLNKRVRVYDVDLGVIHYGIVVSIDSKYNEVKILGEEGAPRKICANLKFVEEANL